jgi:hypothetical protein
MAKSILDKVYEDFDAEKAHRELTAAQAQVETLRDLLTGWERWRQDRNGDAHGEAVTKVPTRRRGQSSRAQILGLMAGAEEEGIAEPAAEWTTPEVREGLGLDESADHGIQVALSRLYRDGKVERVRQGVYRLLPSGASEGEENGDSGS